MSILLILRINLLVKRKMVKKLLFHISKTCTL